MIQAKQRSIALSAVRSQLRAAALDPELITPSEAHAVLDDLCRVETDLVACQWYSGADGRQLALFYRDWEAWQAGQSGYASPFVSMELEQQIEKLLSQELAEEVNHDV